MNRAAMVKGERNSFDSLEYIASPSSGCDSNSDMDCCQDSMILKESNIDTQGKLHNAKHMERNFSSRINFTTINQVNNTSPLRITLSSI